MGGEIPEGINILVLPILNLSHVIYEYMNGNVVRILIADDDPEDLELIEEALLSVEPTAELHTFADGLSAYEYLHTRMDNDLPSLIILDYNMPKLTGIDLLLRLNAQTRYKDIPKIVLSTSSAGPHKHECMVNGAAAYIVKPDSMTEMHNVAKKLVALCRHYR